jgi:hypothetical protein
VVPRGARSGAFVLGVAAVAAAMLSAGGPEAGPAPGGAPGLEVVAAGIPRPLQIATDGPTLVVLAAGAGGDVAGELYRVAVGGARPEALDRHRRALSFGDPGPASLGSLAVRPGTGELFLGEENGRRIWRLDAAGRLELYAAGLARLAGGSTLAFDEAGRLVVLDHVDPRISPAEETVPGLEQFREEDYQGPVIFRLALDPAPPLPRRLDRLPPLFPRGWGRHAGGPLLPRLVAMAPHGKELALLASSGEVFRLGEDGRLLPRGALPVGQYVRVNMVAGPDGTLYVSAGFWVARLFQVAPDGTVTTLAERLADPQGLALVGRDLYLAESALHRIVRLHLPGGPTRGDG